mgnify:FL=1
MLCLYCPEPVRVKKLGLCVKHEWRLRRHGDVFNHIPTSVLGHKLSYTQRQQLDRLWADFVIIEPDFNRPRVLLQWLDKRFGSMRNTKQKKLYSFHHKKKTVLAFCILSYLRYNEVKENYRMQLGVVQDDQKKLEGLTSAFRSFDKLWHENIRFVYRGGFKERVLGDQMLRSLMFNLLAID